MKRAILTFLTLYVAGTGFCFQKPNPTLTPGAVYKNAGERVVCEKGYSKTVRHVSVNQRKMVFKRYGIPWKDHRKYEVDHFISLELGGNNALENLWPQILPEAHQKDKVENWLHREVCDGSMSLIEAQRSILRWEDFLKEAE